MKYRQSVAVACFEFFQNAVLQDALTSRYQHIKFNEKNTVLSHHKLVEFLSGHKKAILGNQRITSNLLSKLPNLKVISRFGSELEPVDLALIQKHKIRLHTTIPNKQAIVELNITLMLNLLRHITADLSLSHNPLGRQLSHCTVGIIGLGQTGQALALLLRQFGCRVMAFDRENNFAFCAVHGIYPMSLKQVLQSSDIVSIHLPHSDSTANLLDETHLKLMLPNSLLINTAHRGIVDENALYNRLKSKQLAGAAFDVSMNKTKIEAKLLALNNFIFTPNIGHHTDQTRINMGQEAIIGLENAKVPAKKTINQ